MNKKTFTSNKSYLFRAILDWLLDNDATPYILVDVSKPQVEVPQEHVKDGQIVLNINPSAVQQWHVDQQAISFSARFSGTARQIYVPMNALMAIYAQENGEGMAFPAHDVDLDDVEPEATDINTGLMPEVEGESAVELLAKDFTSPSKAVSTEVEKTTKKKVSHLRVIK